MDISKLGIKDGFYVAENNSANSVGRAVYVNGPKEQRLKDRAFDMFEALVECRNELAEEYGVEHSTVENATLVIEKACGKSWEEVRKIIDE